MKIGFYLLMKKHPVIVGISGASGAIYGLHMLKALKTAGVEAHVIVSEGGLLTLNHECDISINQLQAMAGGVYHQKDLAAAPASGSFLTSGMVIAPCSIRTLSGIAHSYNENLMIRTADVQLKERRPLILMVRETPLHSGHLSLMKKASDWGAIIMPPVPMFWTKPNSLEAMVTETCQRALDLLKIHSQAVRWRGGA